MRKNEHIIVFVYNSFRDPLCYGLMLNYLKGLKSETRFFHLITYEQKEYALTDSEVKKEKECLKKYNITWYPQKFRGGALLLIKKLINLLTGFFILLSLKLRYRPLVLIAFANVAASLTYLPARILGIPLCIFSYEPHSEFLAEQGRWKRTSLKYRIMHYFEKKSGRNAAFIFTGTSFMRDKLIATGARGNVIRIPTGIDENFFKFDPDQRKAIRHKFSLTDNPVMIYPGKLGDLYITKEIASLCGALYQYNKEFFFMLLTGYDKEELSGWMETNGIPTRSYFIGRVPYDDMPGYLSAADIGVVGIADFPSRIYCSPTKVGEYLMCGLPYIVQANTSEDDLIAKKYDVGVVIENFSATAIRNAIPRIHRLLQENKDEQKERCRNAGIIYRSKSGVIRAFHKMFDELSQKPS